MLNTPRRALPSALRSRAYARLYTGEGHQWLQAGELRRAWESYRLTLAAVGPLRGALRIAIGALVWFGPAWMQRFATALRRRLLIR